ncbi:MAG: molybdopterin molybdotransferase MoeA [Anaerolineae bacterium]|nr:molybdopterin molybdotransferase MoeA [Anaerolineae bacterium]
MNSLISVDAALNQILTSFRLLDIEDVSLDDAFNRVLAEAQFAADSLPPFPNSSMDGFAVRAADLHAAPIRLRVIGDIPAGKAPQFSVQAGEAARIMTGAEMPEGADAVVPVEVTDQNFRQTGELDLPDFVQINQPVKSGDYIRPRGEDVQAGQRVLAKGTLLGAAEIGLMAALGISRVPVIRQPRVAILSTGDELLSPDQPLTPGKIRDANSYSLATLVRQYGGIPIRFAPAADSIDAVRIRFEEALAEQPDVILSSAGVSVGVFDVVRTVIAEIGHIDLWRINIRPGKPLAFGQVRGVPFFGLPGNPVSAMVTFDVFVRPALLNLGGRGDDALIVEAALERPIRSDGRRTFVRVKLRRDTEHGRWIASETGTQSSGALSSMVLADGLLTIPEGLVETSLETLYSVRLLRPIVQGLP